MILARRTSQKHFFFGFVVHQRTPALRQSPLGHHTTGHLGGALNIVGSTRRYAIFTQSNLFRNSTTKQTADTRNNKASAVAVSVFLWKEHSYTQCPAARNNRYLVNRIVLWHQAPYYGMPGLVVCGISLLRFRHHHRLTLCAHHDFVFGQ